MTNFEDIIVNTTKEGEIEFSQKKFIKLSVREIIEKIEKMEIFHDTNRDLYRQYTFQISRLYIFELGDKKNAEIYFNKFRKSLYHKVGYVEGGNIFHEN